MLQQQLDILWIVIAAGMVMLMQVGFLCLESGLARAKNSINVAAKNIVDFCVAGLLYLLFGFGIMFGDSLGGLVGGSYYLFNGSSSEWLIAFIFFQLVFCGTAATIISGAIAERVKFETYLIVTILVTLVIYPVYGHWAWGGVLPDTQAGWLSELGFIDFAGSTVVHSVGAWVALAALLVIGPRRGRFSSKRPPIQGHNLILAALGTLVLWFAWYGFNGGSTLVFEEGAGVPMIILNTNTAGAAGGAIVALITLIRQGRCDVVAMLNGSIAGLVGITASCHLVSPMQAMFIGAVAGVICYWGTHLLLRFKIDDAISAVPAHGMAGVWGTLAVVLGNPADYGTGYSRLEQLGVQCVGIASAFVWTFGLAFVVLYLVSRVVNLRVSGREEVAGLNVTEHGASTELVDLLSDMSTHRKHGDFRSGVTIEPHTEVGQIAAEYNRVIDTVKEEIRAREVAIQKALQAEEKFRNIFDNVRDGIYQSLPEGRFVSANPAMAEILGYESPTALIEGISDISNDLYVDSGLRKQFMERINSQGIIADVEYQLYKKDRTPIWVSGSARAVKDPQGRLLFYEGTIRDITNRKKNAERILKAKEEAERANRVKDEFLANMSHEIRTPMNGVLGMLSVLIDSEPKLTNEQSHLTNVARESAEDLLVIINDILDFSKIEAGKMEFEEVDFYLSDVVESALQLLSEKAHKKGLELFCWIYHDVPQELVGDPTRLRQVLINLLGNAIKFTRNGEVTLRVSKASEAKNDTMLHVSVDDTGIGIDPKAADKLFDAFTQADGTTTREYGGTGLGLAICKKLVERMGGRIGAEGRPGRGSSFWFTARFKKSSPEPLNKTSNPEIENLRVLLVDDHVGVLNTLEHMLQMYKVKTYGVSTGMEALDVLLREAHAGIPYDAAIIDYRMDGMNGMELVDHIKNNPTLKNTRLVILSAYTGALKLDECRQRGVELILDKPLLPNQLKHMLHSLMPVSAKESEKLRKYPAPKHIASEQDKLPQFKILLAEDTNTGFEVVSHQLMTLGQPDVTWVQDGQQLIDELAEQEYDLVLMDCQMPVLDGFSATRTIREGTVASIKEQRTIYIIALTANALVGDREKCLRAGMNDYISKPINRQQLHTALNLFHKHYQERNDAEESEAAEEPPMFRTSNTVSETLAELAKRVDDEIEQLDSEDFPKELIGSFYDESIQMLETLSGAIAEGDFTSAVRMAHSLRGNGQTFKAYRLALLADEVERALDSDDAQILPRLLMQLEQALEAVKQKINTTTGLSK